MTVRQEGNRRVSRKIKYFNLDIIISVGYRVKSKRGIVFRKWANKVLKGYVINERRLNDLTNGYFELKNENIMIKNTLSKVTDIVFNKEYGLDKIFYNGQFYDAYTLVQSIFESAKNEIIIIDSYVDRSILDRLVVKKDSVKVVIYTSITTSIKDLGRKIFSINESDSSLIKGLLNNI